MPIPLRPDEHYGLIGATGSGKSTFLKNKLIPALRKIRNTRFIFLDIKGEYGGKGVVDVTTPSQLNDALYGQATKKKAPPKTIRVLPGLQVDEAYAEELLRAAWSPYERNLQYSTGKGKQYKTSFPIRFVIDDAAAWYAESGGKGQPIFKRWLTLGRQPERCILWVSQRLAIIPKLAVTQSQMMCVFRCVPYDIKRLDNEYGKNIGNAVRSLPKYGYAIISDELPEYVEVYDPVKGKFPSRPKGVML